MDAGACTQTTVPFQQLSRDGHKKALDHDHPIKNTFLTLLSCCRNGVYYITQDKMSKTTSQYHYWVFQLENFSVQKKNKHTHKRQTDSDSQGFICQV